MHAKWMTIEDFNIDVHRNFSIESRANGFVTNIKTPLFYRVHLCVCVFIDGATEVEKKIEPILIFFHANWLWTEYTNRANIFAHGILKSIFFYIVHCLALIWWAFLCFCIHKHRIFCTSFLSQLSSNGLLYINPMVFYSYTRVE